MYLDNDDCIALKKSGTCPTHPSRIIKTNSFKPVSLHLASQYPAISPGTATERELSDDKESFPWNMSTVEAAGATSLAFKHSAVPSDLRK